MPAPASAERTIRWLAIPSALIALAAIILLPWLLETRHRLQNDYWENQLAFAFTALAVAAAGVPFFCLRCVGRFRFWSPLGWIVMASGYALLVIFTLQGPLTPGGQLILCICGIVCLRWSIQGFWLDRTADKSHLLPAAAAARLPAACNEEQESENKRTT